MIITVSDIDGTKQYTLHQFIKFFILWALLAIVLIITIGILTTNSLTTKVDTLDLLTQKLNDTKAKLVAQNKNLHMDIIKKGETLSSMNEHLLEIENIIGLEPDIKSSFSNRANNAKNESIKKVNMSRLTVAQLSILNRSIPNGSPINYSKISDKFGYRTNPVTKKYHHHSGIDLKAKIGTPIYAPADAVVEYAQTKGQYGKYLLLAHSFGFKTAYGHLSRYVVKSGDYVSKGDIIGYVGNTGRSTGAHLHYEIRYLHKWLNPKKFLTWSPETYMDVIASQRLVNWNMLMKQIKQRLQMQVEDKIEVARVNNGSF